MKKICFFILALLLFMSPAADCEAAVNTSPADGHGGRYLICIDPGHEDQPDNRQEPVAPGSAETKARVSSGTRGVVTKVPEYELNLENAFLLEKIFIKDGFGVMLTRRSNSARISNKERAELANAKSADMVVRLHADYSPNNSRSGASILIPGRELPIAAASGACAKLIGLAMTKSGFKVNGIVERSDLSGFNWSKVPAVLVETGFMSNAEEDLKLSKPAYREKLMRAVADGVEAYFGAK